MENARQMPETAAPTDGNELALPEQQKLHEPSVPPAIAAARNGNICAAQHILSEPKQDDLSRVQTFVRQAALLSPAQRERIETDPVLQRKILDALESEEGRRYRCGCALASLELLVLRTLGKFEPQIEVVDDPKVHEELGNGTDATVKVRLRGQIGDLHEASDGKGPADALFLALKKCLQRRFPRIASLKLVAFGVTMVSAGRTGTDPVAEADVLLRDGEEQWRTMASGRSILQASWDAVKEALEYKLLRDKLQEPKPSA